MFVYKYRRQIARYLRLANNAKSRGVIASALALEILQPGFNVRIEAISGQNSDVIIPERVRYFPGGTAAIQQPRSLVKNGRDLGFGIRATLSGLNVGGQNSIS
ncbi:MAG: hypothetical protein JWR80_6633 [Bradyrhizobium sp.]|nr:hypothetical protein [Bradyrhizobium sp.]